MNKEKENINACPIDFEEYEKVKEPNKKQKAFCYPIASGLQNVDRLSTSSYFKDVAQQHIDGLISSLDANNLIDQYYKKQECSYEADKVSLRIVQVLTNPSFSLRPTCLFNIHKTLFSGILKNAGEKRECNISKKEEILNGESVYYTDVNEIDLALKYDFEKEQAFSYEDHAQFDFISHFSSFISNLWQIHPFIEGNTRTIAVFALKYLFSLGYTINNLPFAKDSLYFRNALVRANYSSTKNHIKKDPSFLNLFFKNLIMGESNTLDNTSLYI